MHRALVLSLACAIASPDLPAQEPSSITSLRAKQAAARHDSTRFNALLEMAGEWMATEPDSAFACCLRAQALIGGTGRPKDESQVSGWLGYIEEQRGHIDTAIAYYRKSLAVAERLKDRAGQAVVLNNLGAIYKDQGKIGDALDAHQRSLAIRHALHDTIGIATSLNNIGLILYDQGRIPEAMEHYTEALRMYEAVNDPSGASTALHNIAGIHRDMGDLDDALAYFDRALALERSIGDPYSLGSTEDNVGNVLERQGRLDEALAHYEAALLAHQKAVDPRGMGYSLRNIASVELRRGNAAAALDHASRALEHFAASDDKRGRSNALCTMGQALEALGRSDEALARGEEALRLARELGYPQALLDATTLLGRAYRARSRWREALDMQDLGTAMRDSLRSEDARRSAIRQHYQYAFEKKEAALKAEQQDRLRTERNRRTILLICGGCALLLAVGLWSRLRFVRRSRALIQKERDVSDGLLRNILPEEVANELKQKGHADARHFDRVTILFTDFKDFTRVSEQLSPQELVEELNVCFKAFDGIISARGIEKIKTIGDAYMCAGGLPDPRSSTTADVVHAGLAMQEFMRQRKAERDAQGRPAFEMRLGIHTGPVVAGIVGVRKFQYDIWGDTVNTASRLESSGEVGRVNISGSTHALVNGDPAFRFVARGPVQAKGKGAMEMFFVDRA
jgi:class 3 adenylate cyclase/tetratricopeptide (TPR) repeat protein